MPAAVSAIERHEWIASPLGHYLVEREQAYFDKTVADIFGYNAFQLGMCELDLLRASRIPLRCRAGIEGSAHWHADFRDLPIATGSADLVLLPHVLEFAEHPHQILREVERILMPEAHVVIAGFNPFSLWGLRRKLHGHRGFPWHGRFITLMRVRLARAARVRNHRRADGVLRTARAPAEVARTHEVHGVGRRSLVADRRLRHLPSGGAVREGSRPIMPKWSDQLVCKGARGFSPEGRERRNLRRAFARALIIRRTQT